MIYVAEIQDSKYVKIGYAEKVPERISQLQTGNPYLISVLFSIEGTLMQEQSLHAALTEAFGRIRIPMPPNEWYPGRNGFFQEFLSRLKYGFDAGFTYLNAYSPTMSQGSPKKSKEFKPNLRWGS